MVDDYYEILGVNRDALLRDIRKAYTRLALQYHPDKNEDESARGRFEQIQRAYEVLSDEKKRAEFDAIRWPTGTFHGVPLCTITHDGQSGQIVTGDGWSFQVNLTNTWARKFTFRMVEESSDEDSYGTTVHKFEFTPKPRVTKKASNQTNRPKPQSAHPCEPSTSKTPKSPRPNVTANTASSAKTRKLPTRTPVSVTKLRIPPATTESPPKKTRTIDLKDRASPSRATAKARPKNK